MPLPTQQPLRRSKLCRCPLAAVTPVQTFRLPTVAGGREGLPTLASGSLASKVCGLPTSRSPLRGPNFAAPHACAASAPTVTCGPNFLFFATGKFARNMQSKNFFPSIAFGIASACVGLAAPWGGRRRAALRVGERMGRARGGRRGLVRERATCAAADPSEQRLGRGIVEQHRSWAHRSPLERNGARAAVVCATTTTTKRRGASAPRLRAQARRRNRRPCSCASGREHGKKTRGGERLRTASWVLTDGPLERDGALVLHRG